MSKILLIFIAIIASLSSTALFYGYARESAPPRADSINEESEQPVADLF